MAENKLLTSADVCSILRACAETQVRELKFGGLHVTFGKQAEETGLTPPSPLGNAASGVADPLTPPSVEAITAEQTKQNEQSLAQAEIDAKADRLALLAIEDPVEFERQMMNGELSDESTAGDADEEA